jgi:hypothetical protein
MIPLLYNVLFFMEELEATNMKEIFINKLDTYAILEGLDNDRLKEWKAMMWNCMEKIN